MEDIFISDMAHWIKLAITVDIDSVDNPSTSTTCDLPFGKKNASFFLRSNLFRSTSTESLISPLNLDSCVKDKSNVQPNSFFPHFIILYEHSPQLDEEFDNFIYYSLKLFLREFGCKYYKKVPVSLIWQPHNTVVNGADNIYLDQTRTFLRKMESFHFKFHKRKRLRSDSNSMSLTYELFSALLHQQVTDGFVWTLLLAEVFPFMYTQRFLQNCAPIVLDVMLENIKHYSISRKSNLFLQLQRNMSISDTLRDKNFSQLEVLLKYGYEKFTRDFVSFFATWQYFIFKNFVDYPSTVSLERLPFIQFVFDYIVRRKDVEGVKLLWRAFPCLFLTENELKSVLSTIMHSDRKADIQYVCDTYLEKFPSANFLQPRSLQHYSRCVIRTCLNYNSKLPDGIDELLIPKVCKDYLLLKI